MKLKKIHDLNHTHTWHTDTIQTLHHELMFQGSNLSIKMRSKLMMLFLQSHVAIVHLV